MSRSPATARPTGGCSTTSLPNDERVDQVLAWLRAARARRGRRSSRCTSATSTAPATTTDLTRRRCATRSRTIDACHRAARRGRRRRWASARAPTTCSSAITAWRRSAASGRSCSTTTSICRRSTSVDSSPIVGARPSRRGHRRRVDDLYRALKDKHPRSRRCYTRERPAGRAIGCAATHGCPRSSASRTTAGTSRRGQRLKRDAEGAAAALTATTRATGRCTACSSPPARRSARASSSRAFENVHVYELMCRVLGLRPALE